MTLCHKVIQMALIHHHLSLKREHYSRHSVIAYSISR